MCVYICYVCMSTCSIFNCSLSVPSFFSVPFLWYLLYYTRSGFVKQECVLLYLNFSGFAILYISAHSMPVLPDKNLFTQSVSLIQKMRSFLLLHGWLFINSILLFSTPYSSNKKDDRTGGCLSYPSRTDSKKRPMPSSGLPWTFASACNVEMGVSICKYTINTPISIQFLDWIEISEFVFLVNICKYVLSRLCSSFFSVSNRLL